MAKEKILQTIVDVAGSIDPSLGKAIDSAVGQLDKIDLKAVAVGTAVAGISIAAGKAVWEAGKYLADLGSQFDNATDSIRIGTGATGDALDSLLEDFDAVYGSVPTTMDDAALAIADYNTRLNLTGDALQGISQQAIQAADMLDEDLGAVIEESSQAFSIWNVDAENMGDAMDYIFKVSQSTGAGFTDLFSRMQQYGPALQEMGYGFETASALMGQMDKAGVNTEQVLASMQRAIVNFSKEGIGASEGLAMVYEDIMSAADAADAVNIASEFFGTRAGPTMAAAIRDGALAVGDLTADLLESGETIAGAAGDTYDFAENLQLFRQQAEIALKPLANTVFDSLNKLMPSVARGMEVLGPGISDLVEIVEPFVSELADELAPALEDIVPLLVSIASTAGSTFIPPLLKIVGVLLPGLTGALEAVLPIVDFVFSGIAFAMESFDLEGYISNAVNILTLLLDFIGNVFTGNWDAAWQNIQDIFASYAEGLGYIFKAPINFIIDGINSLTSGLGSITIPDWIPGIGGKSFSIPQIPRLASGGFTDGISIAGEAGSEAVISFDPAYRQDNISYWAKAGRMLGLSNLDALEYLGGAAGASTMLNIGGINFSPKIVMGNGSDITDLIRQLRKYEPEFVDFLLDALERKGVGYFGPRRSRPS